MIRHQQGSTSDMTWNLLSISKGGAWKYVSGTGGRALCMHVRGIQLYEEVGPH